MTVVRQDTFTRSNQSGWGTASDSNTWTSKAGTGTENITSDEGELTSTSASYFNALGASLSSADAEGLVRFEVTGATSDTAGIFLRLVDTSNYYLFRYDGAGHMELLKKVSGTSTHVNQTSFTPTLGQKYWIRCRAQGTTVEYKHWQDGTTEPSSWDWTGTDSSLSGSTNFVGLYGFASSTNTALFDSFSVDDLATKSLGANTEANFLTSVSLAVADRAKFFTDAKLAAQTRDTFKTRPALSAHTQAKFKTRPLLGVATRATWRIELALKQAAHSRFLINSSLKNLGVLARSTYKTSAALAFGTRSKFALRIAALGTPARDTFKTRLVAATRTIERFLTRAALDTQTRSRFATRITSAVTETLSRFIIEAPSANGTGIGGLTVTTKSQTWSGGPAGSPGTETDITYEDSSNSGWTVGTIPSYGGMPLSSWYEVDGGVTGTNQHSLSTSQPDGALHWLDQSSGAVFAGSEDPTFKNAGDFTEQAPTGTDFRRYYKIVGDANDANGIQWTGWACIYPGDPGAIAVRLDLHNPSGSAISLAASDSLEIALIGGMEQGDSTWAPANGKWNTLGGTEAAWSSTLVAGEPDYAYITPANGSGVSVGTLTVKKTSLAGLGWSSLQNEYLQNASRLKFKVQGTLASVAAGATQTVYFLYVLRRGLTSADAAAIAADYLNPGTPTGPFQSFSYDEACYVYDCASSNNLTTQLDLSPAHVTTRFKPRVKILNWTSGTTPPVTFGGTLLTAGTHYRWTHDATNNVLYLQLYWDVVPSGATSGQRNNAILTVGTRPLSTVQRARFQTRTILLGPTHGAFKTRAILAGQGRGDFKVAAALGANIRTTFKSRIGSLVARSRSRFIERAVLTTGTHERFLTRAALATRLADTFKVYTTVINLPFTFALRSVKQALHFAFGTKQALTFTFARRTAVPTPNSTVTSTMTATDVNGALVANLTTVVVTVTFPDGTASTYDLTNNVTNLGNGLYSVTYTTKGPGEHLEDWQGTDPAAHKAEFHNELPVSF